MVIQVSTLPPPPTLPGAVTSPPYRKTPLDGRKGGHMGGVRDRGGLMGRDRKASRFSQNSSIQDQKTTSAFPFVIVLLGSLVN